MNMKQIVDNAVQQSDAAADAAYEVHRGEKPIRFEVNTGDNRKTHPMVIFIDGLEVAVPIAATEQANAVSHFALVEAGAVSARVRCPNCEKLAPEHEAQDKTHLCVDCQRVEWEMKKTNDI